jgi:hypothetical protein
MAHHRHHPFLSDAQPPRSPLRPYKRAPRHPLLPHPSFPSLCAPSEPTLSAPPPSSHRRSAAFRAPVSLKPGSMCFPLPPPPSSGNLDCLRRWRSSSDELGLTAMAADPRWTGSARSTAPWTESTDFPVQNYFQKIQFSDFSRENFRKAPGNSNLPNFSATTPNLVILSPKFSGSLPLSSMHSFNTCLLHFIDLLLVFASH